VTSRSSAREHALEVIEFPEVLDRVAASAGGPEGRRRVLALRPLSDPDRAREQLVAVGVVREMLASVDGFELGSLPDARPALERLRIEGAVLDAEALVQCASLLATARRAAGRLQADRPESAIVDALAGRLWYDRAIEERIERCFDESGEVADSASSELRRLRRQLLGSRGKLVDRLEEYARGLPERIRVSDGSVTLRGGRYCIPIRREGKSSVGGLVHDASGSRQTLFVEPAMAIDSMNDIRELEISIHREIDRILRELTGLVAAHQGDLADGYDALCDLDALRARAAFAGRLDCALPELVDAQEPIRISAGRHPLLALEGDRVVPFDLELDPDERVLLISGPNAGGKTVLLKSVGLLIALARSGIIPPVGKGTRLPYLGGPYAIIGDEQSIAASLSTFGAQTRNLAEILAEAGADDLVLIDEIGSATDPTEGGALAAATLAALARQVRLTIATTHLGDLKGLAEESAGTVNASLQFDGDRLEPTYRLEKNLPGRSYALEIAARLGIPAEVLNDARSRLDSDHRSLDELLARLEGEQAQVAAVREELEAQGADLAGRSAELDRERADLEARSAASERDAAARVEAALREARAEVESAIAGLEEAYREEGGGAEARREARRAARDVVERGIRESRERKTALDSRSDVPAPEGLIVGGAVGWGSGRSGVLVELRADRGIVEVDGVRLTMPASELVPIAESAASRSRKGGPGGGRRPMQERRERRPGFEVKTEIDLRGLRVEEVEAALIPAVDAAVVAELPWLRIIHGKGTGALREVVGDLLARDPRIAGYKTGDPREGGTGVTIVEFE
jgi:DNA mismatch repair protein MutS2